tara:strand:- start:529 stop:2211 length:1683 start_codon:yes stop_codon:yes gene_type:complete
VLKAAWASVGIGLAIIAVEQLIENWDKLSDALGFTSAANRKAGEEYKEIAGSLASAKNEGTEYLQVLVSTKQGTDSYNLALEKVISTFGNAIDKEADLNTQRSQAMKLAMAKIALDETLIKKQQKKQQLDEKDAEVLALQAAARRGEKIDTEKLFALKAEALELRTKISELTERELTQESKLSSLINKNADKQKKRDEDKKKAEQDANKLKTDADRKAEQDAKYLADLNKRLDEEILLSGIETEEERAFKVAELRYKEQEQAAIDAGATEETLLNLKMSYLDKLSEISAGYREAENAEVQADRQQALADEQALEDELFVIRTNGRDRELTAEQLKYEEEILMSYDAQAQEELRAQQEFDSRMLKAGENQMLIEMVEEEFQNNMTRIAQEGEDERNDIIEEGTELDTKIRRAGAKAVISATRDLFGTMEALAGENEKAAKGFAITGVLLAQAVALANGIKVATESSATVWDMIAGIVASTAAVLGAFVGVKSILNEATDGGGGNVGGGVGRPNVQALVPTGVARLDSPEGGNNQAFIVQSELEGANMQANNMYGQTSLNPG